MKVGLILPGFSADEQDWCIPALLDMVRSLALHCELYVLALRYPYRRALYQVYGARVQALGWGQRVLARKGLAWPDALAALLGEQRRGRFDLLQAFWAGEAGWLAGAAGRLLGCPAIVSLAGGELVALPDIGYGGQLQFGRRLLIGASLRMADHLTVGSHYLRRLAEKQASGRPVTVQPLGVDCTRFTPGEYRPQARPRLLHAASLLAVKDQATLLRALALLRQDGLPVQLELAGAGPEHARLQALAQQLALETTISWRGALAHDQLPARYQAADAFVLSSRHEAQSLVLAEALACAIPIVSTAVGIAPELVPASSIVAVQNPAALATALATLLARPDRGRVLGQDGHALVEQRFSLEAATAGWLGIYQKLARE